MYLGRRDFIILGGAITALPIAWLAVRAQQNDHVRALQLRVLRYEPKAPPTRSSNSSTRSIQVAWTTQLPWTAASSPSPPTLPGFTNWAKDTQLDLHRSDISRLFRQAPAVTEIVQLDANGKERLRVSRLYNDKVEAGADFSREPEFTIAIEKKVYYGPVFYSRGSEPS